MSIAMHEHFKKWLVDNNLIPGMTLQMYFWDDSGTATARYAVVQPNGGTMMSKDLGNEYYMLLSLIGAKTDRKKTMDAAQAIIDFTQENPTDSCLGGIQMAGPTPVPMLTEEGRCECQLSFRIVFGA